MLHKLRITEKTHNCETVALMVLDCTSGILNNIHKEL